MRIALCISGMPRSFKRCYNSLFTNFIDIYRPDIFVSTWKSEIIDPKFPETDSAEEMIDLLKPIKFDIELFNDQRKASFETNRFKEFADQGGLVVSRTIPMFYKIYLADLHRFIYEQEQQFAYDIVVRCRSDLIFHEAVKLEEAPSEIVCFPVKNSTSHINDQFWYCNSETSSKMCSLYYYIPKLWHSGILIHGEAMLYSYVVSQGFTIKAVEINYDILR